MADNDTGIGLVLSSARNQGRTIYLAAMTGIPATTAVPEGNKEGLFLYFQSVMPYQSLLHQVYCSFEIIG